MQTAEEQPQPGVGLAGTLDAKLMEYPWLGWAASKANVSPCIIAGGCAVWFLCFLLWGFMGELVCTLVALVYPAFASFKALEDGKLDVLEHWMMYWITYAVAMLAESFVYRIVSSIPFYHLAKIGFIIWLSSGAGIVYNWTIAPLLRLYRASLDGCFDKLSGELQRTVQPAFSSVESVGGYVSKEIERVAVKAAKHAAAKAVSKAAGGSRSRAQTPTPPRASGREEMTTPVGHEKSPPNTPLTSRTDPVGS